MMRIAVVEDEREYREQLEEFVRQYAEERHADIQVAPFESGESLCDQYRPVYDIILLDIEMPGMNGMDAAERIRQADRDVVIVFITQMAQYAIRGYSVGALDFVLKPITYSTFAMKLDRAIERVKKRSGGQIWLQLPDGAKKLDISRIYYVEVQNHMLHYHTEEGEYVLRGTMVSAEKELARFGFMRCNYWYLVNLYHVTRVKKDMVTVGGRELEISRRNKTAFMSALAACIGGNT